MKGTLYFRSHVLLSVCFLLTVLSASVAKAENEGGGILLVSEQSNKVTTLDGNKKLTLQNILLHRSNSEFRLVVNLWRRDARLKYVGQSLLNEDVLNQMIRLNDVVVFGPIDDERKKVIEQIPAVARALSLPSGASGSRDVMHTQNALIDQTPKVPPLPSVAETSVPATPVPRATPAPSTKPATPLAQTPAANVEQRTSVWPWIVGILVLVVIVALVFKRRT